MVRSMLVQRIQKYGNSYGIIIPNPIMKLLAIKKGDNLRMDISSRRIITLEKIGDEIDGKSTQKERRK